MDRFKRVEELFQHAWDLATDDRADFLQRATHGDDALYQEVDGLLQEARKAGQSPVWDSSALANEAYYDRQFASRRAPAELGRYQLRERIGTGGMGVVYKAVRIEKDIPQTVAIKFLQAHPEDELALARFVRERRILAGLEHPNIARLLDGGTTPDGLPFLVMEYVNGLDLTRYLAQTKPALPAVLGLFTKICSAVSYTHQNLIAHRDLKPANILVTNSGEPKVLDFGIATLFDKPAVTKAGDLVLTPKYASPEQVRGELAGPASDIYTLGVLLYEMLTGRLPYAAGNNGPLALARAITDQVPAMLQSKEFELDQDLEMIVQMALRKEPSRRYASVEHFSADIAAYLGGYPVSARPDTTAYRAWKFVTRNRVWIGALTVTVLAIAGGAGAALHEASVANRRAEDVRKLAESMMVDANDSITLLPGSTTARHQLLTRGVRFLDDLVETMGRDRRSAIGIADGYQKFALLQGLSQINVGDRAGAIGTERKAEALLRPLLERSPQDLELGGRLVAVYSGLSGLLMASGDVDHAAEYARKELDLARKLSALDPGNLELQSAVADAYVDWGDINGNPLNNSLGDAGTAVAAYQSAAAIVERIVQADPTQVDRKQGLAGIHTRLGKVHAAAYGDPAAALAEFSTAASLSEWIRANSTPNPWREMNVAIRDTNLVGPLLALNRGGEARGRADQAIEILQAILKSDPQIVSARRELAMAFLSRGQVEAAAGGNHRSAIDWYQRALTLFRELMAVQPDYANDLGLRSIWRSLAGSQLATANYAGALESAREQLRFDERLLQISPKNATASENQAAASEQSGDAARMSGNIREARAWYQKALDILTRQQAAGKLSRLAAQAIPRLATHISAR